ncbi:ABC transporter substrate-binding protein [uncultured Desulfuromonas sp.]|uniref:ABC transporter substrate-binding protein n=1 Tax=uncultured Desulfuromonas sp. TaxID=181013 RepID=UPI002AAB7A99|nr:ABC transporter substrate-binding protein [uncultured Desulfuromonas sp.]
MSIQPQMTIKQIIETWPQTLDVFTANGFEQFSQPEMIDRVGRFLKLESALSQKGYDCAAFIALLQERIDAADQQADITLVERQRQDYDIDLAGLLPCPVRMPLLEVVTREVESFETQTGLRVRSRLEAASVGADWMEEHIHQATSVAELPDLFVSAGFDVFFDPQGIGGYCRDGLFAALEYPAVNGDFDGMTLADPRHAYSMISVVPAVFMVDKQQLGDLPIPRTWADILEPIYAGKISLPVGDFDLFNAILLTLHKEFGDEGIERLGRSMLSSLHPAQMVKTASRQQDDKPLVTILPYFFTRMATHVPSVEIVWPEDGAIISPIFMLAKRDRLDELRPLADLVAGEEVGTILAQKGLFPSLNPQVKNSLPEVAPWKWLGWDYIYQQDIAGLIRHAETVFNRAVAGGDA